MDQILADAAAFITTAQGWMEALLAQAGDFIAREQAWAGPLVGTIILAESLAIVGLAVPATALMVGIGGLIGAGTLEAVPVLAWCIVGAIVGDAISYFAGRLLGPGICHRWPLRRHRPAIARARLFFRRYGVASIFVGRFLGPVRSTIPLVAGVMMMSQRRFQLANVGSALVWVPLMFAPGYLAAKGIADLGGFDGETLLLVVALALAASILATGLIVRLAAGDGRRERRRGGERASGRA